MRHRLVALHVLLRSVALALPYPINSYILEEFRIRLESFSGECQATISTELSQVESAILSRDQKVDEKSYNNDEYEDYDDHLDEDNESMEREDPEIDAPSTMSDDELEEVSSQAPNDLITEQLFETTIGEKREFLSSHVDPQEPDLAEDSQNEGTTTSLSFNGATALDSISMDGETEDESFVVGDTDEEEDHVLSRLEVKTIHSSPEGVTIDVSPSVDVQEDDDRFTELPLSDSNKQKEETPEEESEEGAKVEIQIQTTKLKTKKKKKKRSRSARNRLPNAVHPEIPKRQSADADDDSFFVSETSTSNDLIIVRILRSILKSAAFTVGLVMIMVAANILVKLTLEIIYESIKGGRS